MEHEPDHQVSSLAIPNPVVNVSKRKMLPTNNKDINDTRGGGLCQLSTQEAKTGRLMVNLRPAWLQSKVLSQNK